MAIRLEYRVAITLALLLAVVLVRACPAEAEVTYDFRGPAHKAFKESKDRWNDRLPRDMEFKRTVGVPDIVIIGRCRPRTDLLGSYNFKAGSDLLWINECADLPISRRVMLRQFYSHELGHHFIDGHIGGRSTMNEFWSRREPMFPTARDARIAMRYW